MLVTKYLAYDIPALVAVAGTCKTWRAMVKDNTNKLNVAMPPPPKLLLNFTPRVARSSRTAKKVPHQTKNKDAWNYAAWIAECLHLFPNLEDFVVVGDLDERSYAWFDGLENSRRILHADPTFIAMHTTMFLTDELLQSLAKNCNKLRSLEAEPLRERPAGWSFGSSDFGAYNLFVSPSHMQKLFDKCPRLVETYFSSMTESTQWKSIADNTSAIRDIKTWLIRIKENGVGTTAKKLKLEIMPDEDEIEMIVSTLPNLEAVEFACGITDDVGGMNHLARLSRLRWLSFVGVGIRGGQLQEMLKGIGVNLYGLQMQECGMTCDDFRAIGTYCKSLRYLGVSCMSSHGNLQSDDITHEDISATFSGCGATLRYLDIGCNDFVDDRMLEAISDHCPEIIYLDFSNSSEITDYGLGRIASGCKKMQVLCMMYCDGLGIYTCAKKEDFISNFATPLLGLRNLLTINLCSDVWAILDRSDDPNAPSPGDVVYRYGYVEAMLHSHLPNFKSVEQIM